jgi:hypothetical protein
MRIRSLLFTALILLLFSVPGYPQGVGNDCDISGTWYGGSDPNYQYLASFAPLGAGRYSFSAQNGYDVRPIFPGYVAATAWVGEAVKMGRNTFDTYLMSYWIPGGTSLPEVDIAHSRVEFIDCNTFTSTIDVFGAYLSFTPDKTPFVTPVDLDFLVGGTIVETYHRMPTTLTGFQSAVASARAGAARAAERPKPPVAPSSASKRRR